MHSKASERSHHLKTRQTWRNELLKIATTEKKSQKLPEKYCTPFWYIAGPVSV
jgi:hypothetical protein